MIPQGQLNCPEFEERYKWLDGLRPTATYIDEMRDIVDYCKADVAVLTQWFRNNRKEYNKMFKMDKVKKVIFNPPATIVYWFDGTKTIVKVQDGEIFDKEKGFAMACAKKFFGNEGNYYNEFRKHGADVSYIERKVNLDSVVPNSILEDVRMEIEKDLVVGFDKGKEIDRKFEEFSKLEEYVVKSKIIVKRIKEGLNYYWGLKLYVDPDTKPNILDMVVFNDSGKSLRFICDLDEVESGKLDDSIRAIMKNVSESCI